MPTELLFYLPFAGLLLAILGFAVLRIWRSNPGYHWLVAVFGSASVWIAVLLQWGGLNETRQVLSWGSSGEAGLIGELIIINDYAAWMLSFGVVTLLLAIVLTEVIRAVVVDWWVWFLGFVVTVIVIFTIMAASVETLLFGWAALDLVELGIVSWQIKTNDQREQLAGVFLGRIGAILVLMFGSSWGASLGYGEGLISSSSQINLIYLAAAGLRLGVLPMHKPFLEEGTIRRSLGNMLRFCPPAAGFILLIRLAQGGPVASFQNIIHLIIIGAGCFAVLNWLGVKDRLDGRASWLLACSSLAFGSAIAGDFQGVIIWAFILMIGGGFLIQVEVQRQFVIAYVIGVILIISGAPFTPVWLLGLTYPNTLLIFKVFYALIHGFLLLGAIRIIIRIRSDPREDVDPWIRLVYPLGIGILLFSLILPGLITPFPAFSGSSWLSLIPLGFVIGYLWVWRYRPIITNLQFLEFVPIQQISNVASMGWFYRSAWRLYRWSGYGIKFINKLLEGDGGVLWAILLIILVITFLSQNGVSG